MEIPSDLDVRTVSGSQFVQGDTWETIEGKTDQSHPARSIIFSTAENLKLLAGCAM